MNQLLAQHILAVRYRRSVVAADGGYVSVLRSIRRMAELLLLGLPLAAQAQYAYTTNAPNTNTITITRYVGSGGAVVIPSNISGKAVTDIGITAFEACAGVTSVTIPDSVISIGAAAFGACGDLISVAIGSSVASIGEDAFYLCTNLTAISAVAGNSNFSSTNGVLFDKSRHTLHQCPGGKVGSYAIPDGVNTIGYAAFSDCIRLTSVSVPSSVAHIADYAFWACANLANVYFLGNAPVAGVDVFYGATNVTVHHLSGTTGWPTVPDTWADRATALWSGGGSFENLDFESAMVPDVQWGGNVPISEGLPAWNGSHSSILHNNATLGDSALAIIGPWGWSSSVISGSYSAFLIGGANGSAWIEQTALVPLGTRSLRMKVKQGPAGFGVSLNGTTIPMFSIQASVWAGDVTPFGGFSSTLTITANAGGSLGVNPVTIDDIEFSPQAVVLRIIGLSGNLSFGNVVTGQTKTAILTITNSGNTALAVMGIGYPSGFSGAWSGSIAASNSTNVTVMFAPVAVTNYSGAITVTNDSTSGTGQIGIAGSGVSGRPQAQADAKFGVISNRFGFNIRWANGRVVVVDGCTNLANPAWVPLQTNNLTTGSAYFSDPKWTNLMGRYYRIRAP